MERSIGTVASANLQISIWSGAQGSFWSAGPPVKKKRAGSRIVESKDKFTSHKKRQLQSGLLSVLIEESIMGNGSPKGLLILV